MAKYMECDVCGTKQDGTEQWIEAAIPAQMLGEVGDEYLSIDICSFNCLLRLGSGGEEPAERNMTNPYPEPDDIEEDTARMAMQVAQEMGVAAQNGDRQGLEREITKGKRMLRPVQPTQPQAPPGRYLSEEEREEVTGVKKRW